MTGYILWVMVYTISGGVSQQAALFPTKQACEVARVMVKEEFSSQPGIIFQAVCLPKSKFPNAEPLD